jgi:hypothetical protein
MARGGQERYEYTYKDKIRDPYGLRAFLYLISEIQSYYVIHSTDLNTHTHTRK